MGITDEKPRAARTDGADGHKLGALELEQHSIDWVPLDQRYGTPSKLRNVWFVANINLTAMATGVTALAIGANLLWTLVAVVAGSLFGTVFMAFHSAQGPQLGLPQLVQSRAQFGYIGAAVTVWVFALINYMAYNISDAILSGAAMNNIIGISAGFGFFLAALIAALIALFGYEQIHKVSRLLTWPLIAMLALLCVGAGLRGGIPAGSFAAGHFKLAPFMTVFVITAGFQLGWAPYVSDYSRYLPPGVGVRATSFWTYVPSALSAIWVFVLGAIASAPNTSLGPVGAFRAAGNGISSGVGWVCILLLLLGLLCVMAMNAYGGSLTMISIADSFVDIKPTRRIRAITIAIMGLVVWGLAHFIGEARFDSFYNNALIFLAYIFTPWTAINLTDYFFVRRGHYSIKDIFDPNGIYGRWGWRGIGAYLIGLAAMAPFFVTTPYTGPLAKDLGSVDYSIFIGLPVSVVAYLLLARSLDLSAEQEHVDESVLGVAEMPMESASIPEPAGD